MAAQAPELDGRAERWVDHRRTRRLELVEAAVAAIDAHGPSASIAQVATVAGVSKPVLYRYFTDKDDLYAAVGEHGAERVLAAVREALAAGGSIRSRLDAACLAYLSEIDEHPNVFFLLLEHRSATDPLANGKDRVAATLSRTIGGFYRSVGIDASGAEPWAHGVVGHGLAHGEWWLRRRTMSRRDSAAYLATFLWHAFEGFSRDHGFDLGNA